MKPIKHPTRIRQALLVTFAATALVTEAEQVGKGLNPGGVDLARGGVFVLDDPFEKEAKLSAWRYYSSSGTARGNSLTPLLFRKTNLGQYEVVGRGKTRINQTAGTHEHAFDLVSGTDQVTPGVRFGWWDGGDDRINAGSIDMRPDDSDASICFLGEDHASIKPGEQFSVTSILPRIYAVEARTGDQVFVSKTPEDVSGGRIPTPSMSQYFWHEQERLMFVCLDPCTWQGREYDNHTTDLKDMKLPLLDTDQWCEAALAWGAREILFVAKHTGGFCWWQTDSSDYSVKNISWKNGKGDLLEDLARSCGKHGLNMGIYVYPGDDTWGAGIGSGGKTRDPSKQEDYNRVFRQQLRETIRLAARHTRVVEVWFDGSCIIPVEDIVKEEAPEAVVFQSPAATVRWVGNEQGRLDYGASWSTLLKKDMESGLSTAAHSSSSGNSWAPLEVNTTLHKHYWFWSENNMKQRKTLDELMRCYYASAGQGQVMLLNSAPDINGLIPDDDMKLYRALGAEIERRFSTATCRHQWPW